METLVVVKKYEDIYEQAEKIRAAGYRMVRALRRGEFVTFIAIRG